MIKHLLKDDLVHVSIDGMDFSYRIPLQKLGKIVKWRIGKYGTEGIVMKNVSKWMLQLFTKKEMEDKYLEEFKSIVQEYVPGNSIDWKETLLAVYVQHEYNRLKTAGELDENEMISAVEEKYNLP